MSTAKHIYEFAGFVLDPNAGELKGPDGLQIKTLSGKPFDVLVFLVEKANTIKTRTEILEACWKDNTTDGRYVDSAIFSIRQALKDDKHELIQTHSGKGYSFKANFQVRLSDAIEQVKIRRPEPWTAQSTNENTLWGGIEAGGTKFIVGIGRGSSGELIERKLIRTHEDRTITLTQVKEFFLSKAEKHGGDFHGIGIACFGPLDLNLGIITNTPKEGWDQCPILDDVFDLFPKKVPVALTTDVNGALLGEIMFGVGKGRNKLETCAYITVGTGIGAGIWTERKFRKCLGHPEWGHIRVPLAPVDRENSFDGTCRHKPGKEGLYGICLEGAASGPAIEKRCKTRGENIHEDDEVWRLVARYLGIGIYNLIAPFQPELIILGGGVMRKKDLLRKVREEVIAVDKSYLPNSKLKPVLIDDYIVAPILKAPEDANYGSENEGVYESGVRGAIVLAQMAGGHPVLQG